VKLEKDKGLGTVVFFARQIFRAKKVKIYGSFEITVDTFLNCPTFSLWSSHEVGNLYRFMIAPTQTPAQGKQYIWQKKKSKDAKAPGNELYWDAIFEGLKEKGKQNNGEKP
jgi:hypothetical protein